MRNSEKSNDLLRSDVSNMLHIRRCDILIEVLPSLQTARYIYSYNIERTAAGEDKWREVFAYPIEDVMIDYARPGSSLAANSGEGLHFEVTTLNTRQPKASLIIDFDRKIPIGYNYEFHYGCRTRIEAIKNVSWLGGRGAIWFWCAHEFPCDTISVTVEMPPGVQVKDTHPEPTSKSMGVTFTSGPLDPREFVVALLTYEKQMFGIPVQYVGLVKKGVAFLLAVVASLIGAALFTFLINKVKKGG